MATQGLFTANQPCSRRSKGIHGKQSHPQQIKVIHGKQDCFAARGLPVALTRRSLDQKVCGTHFLVPAGMKKSVAIPRSSS
jgi:hypothetical protein